jgi:HEAT repeat protein
MKSTIENLNEPEDYVRQEALKALGQVSPEILAGILKYGDDLRPLAASLLGEMKYTFAVEVLIGALEDDNMQVVKKAVRLLPK